MKYGNEYEGSPIKDISGEDGIDDPLKCSAGEYSEVEEQYGSFDCHQAADIERLVNVIYLYSVNYRIYILRHSYLENVCDIVKRDRPDVFPKPLVGNFST